MSEAPKPKRKAVTVDCPACGRVVALTPTGRKLRAHAPTPGRIDRVGMCGGTGKSVPS